MKENGEEAIVIAENRHIINNERGDSSTISLHTPSSTV